MSASTRTPRAHGDATRARLLETAGQLFAQAGFAATSNKAICTAAGTDLAAINYHFGGRDGLYRAVLLEGYAQLVTLESLREVYDRDCSLEDKVRAFIGVVVDRLLGERNGFGRVFARELLAPSAHFAALVEEGVMPRFRLLSELLGRIIGRPADDPATLRCVASVMGPCLMMLVLDRDTPSPISALFAQAPEALKQHLGTFALAGLAAIREGCS